MTSGDVLTVLSLAVGIGTPFTVGLVLLLRGAGKRVAWILLAGALSIVVVFGAHVIGTPWALVVGSEWTVLFLWPLALAYVYPDGRLPSRRWRPMAWLAAASGAGTLLLLPLQPTLEGPDGDVKNPIQIGPGLEDLLAPVFWACWFGLLAALIGGALSQRARYKAGGPELRRQVLWLAYGAVIPPLWLGGTSLIGLFVSFNPPDVAVLMLTHAWFAIAVAVAVTRHGLYEIDRLFNRTLVYAVLTALLAGTYALAALLAGQLAGGSAFAASVGTLAAALAFRPLRDRLQAIVDRRFARQRVEGVRLLRDFLDDVRARQGGAGGRRRGARARARRPLRRGRLPPARDRRLRRPRRPPARRAARRRPRAHADRPRGRRACCTTRRSSGGPTSCTRCSTRRPSRSRSAACGSSCGCSSPRSSRRGRGSPRPATPSAAGSSATCTTARSSGSSRSASCCGGCSARCPARRRSSAPALDAAVDEVAATIADLRTIAAGVRPPRLDEGLTAALEDLARGSAVPVELEASGDRAPPEVEAVAYFIACEALTNAVKHGSPSRVTVQTERSDDVLRLVVADDGVGGAAPASGRGLAGMADRVAAQGGTLALESPPGAGTRIAVELPCVS